jgi:hypothetical protein
MVMLAIVNMLLLLLGFLMRLRKQKRARVGQLRPTLAVEQITEAHES